jgi:hypothetical protein
MSNCSCRGIAALDAPFASASRAGRPPRSKLRLEHDDDNRATEGVDDLCFEGTALEVAGPAVPAILA